MFISLYPEWADYSQFHCFEEADLLGPGSWFGTLAVWRSGNGVRYINKVKLCRSGLALGFVTSDDLLRVYHPGICPCQLSLASLRAWVGAMCILPEMVSAISGKKRRP